MSRTPLVSVCIPSYNHARFLPAAIESVLSQTYRSFEIVVVDDGSTDDSLAIAERYAAQYPSLIKVFVHLGKRQRGISATANLAFQKSNGEYWCGLPSDDAFYPDKLQLQIECLQNNPDVSLVYGYASPIDEMGNQLPGNLGVDASGEPDPLARLLQSNYIYGQTVMARRECLYKVGLHDEALVYSDWELWIRVLSHYRVSFLPRPVAFYRIHRYNTSVGSPPEVQLARHIAVMTAIRQKAYSAGGRLCNSDSQALIYLQLAYLFFCKGDTTRAAQDLQMAFQIAPSLFRRAGFITEWVLIRQREIRLFMSNPRSKYDFIRWTFTQIHNLYGLGGKNGPSLRDILYVRFIILTAYWRFAKRTVRKKCRQFRSMVGHLGGQLRSSRSSCLGVDKGPSHLSGTR
ncbi:MAG: glycosyltransferase [Acidiferrobacterales bacterium]